MAQWLLERLTTSDDLKLSFAGVQTARAVVHRVTVALPISLTKAAGLRPKVASYS